MRHRILTLAEVERRHILNTLNICGRNRTLAAQALGLSVRGLRIKLHQYEHEGFLVPPPARKHAMPNAWFELPAKCDL